MANFLTTPLSVVAKHAPHKCNNNKKRKTNRLNVESDYLLFVLISSWIFFGGVLCFTHPICLLVEGAWVITELDWGEGRACWITMLVSWLAIRAWDCWCWPWPACPCSAMFCKEEARERKKKQSVHMRLRMNLKHKCADLQSLNFSSSHTHL